MILVVITEQTISEKAKKKSLIHFMVLKGKMKNNNFLYFQSQKHTFLRQADNQIIKILH